jgi:glutamine amidotransferase
MAEPFIAVVDYCKGNLMSVERGLQAAGGNARIVDDPSDILSAQAIVLPGVGAFSDAVQSMVSSGQMAALREALAHGVPFLGICLGLHLLFEEGTEGPGCADEAGRQGNARGLGILPGVVDIMPGVDEAGIAFKVPHVGWNTVEPVDGCDSPLLAGVDSGEYFYFTHSYIVPDGPWTRATTVHSRRFPCLVEWGNAAFGVQFHPEKSSDAGLRVLRNFIGLARKAQNV